MSALKLHSLNVYVNNDYGKFSFWGDSCLKFDNIGYRNLHANLDHILFVFANNMAGSFSVDI
jgi:hypothetical protein